MGAQSACALVAVFLAPWPACGATDGYAGSKACAACHRRIYTDYQTSAMGRSVRPALELNGLITESVKVNAPALDRVLTVFRKDGRLYQSEYQEKDGKRVFETTHELQYAVGSGANGLSFIVRRGNYLFQAPLSYYSRTKSWNFSPGYEHADYGFSRPIYEACIVCHSGRVLALPYGEGEYQDSPFEEMAVGCENCHGPGAAHAQNLRPIANPRKLAPRLADDICMKCHQGGDARILLPGRKYSDITAGEPLAKFLAIFRVEPRSVEADLLEHHEAMKSSRCFQATNGKLSCLSCHTVHTPPTPDGAAAYYRAQCLMCHKETHCRLPRPTRIARSRGDACIDCHMPKRRVQEISHSALTNHRIATPSRDFVGSPKSEESRLVQSNAPSGISARDQLPLVTRLAALGELLPKAPNLLSEYLLTLERANRDLPDDPTVLAALGRKYLQESNPAAAELLLRALERGNTASTTYFDLGEALSRSGRLEEAIRILETGQRLHPFSKELRKSLVLRRIAMKQEDAARKDMELYMEIFPEDTFMRQLLTRITSVSRP